MRVELLKGNEKMAWYDLLATTAEDEEDQQDCSGDKCNIF